MENFQNNVDVVLINKKFGVITNNQVILNSGSSQNKINFETISRVNLVKQRVFYTNIIFLILSGIFMVAIFAFNDLHIKYKMGIALVATACFLLSISHKFYFYKLIIKLFNTVPVNLR